MELSRVLTGPADQFNEKYIIDAGEFMKVFSYVGCTFRLIAGSSKENNWQVLPLSAFQEASMIYNVGTIKKDPVTTQQAFSLLSYVIMKRGE